MTSRAIILAAGFGTRLRPITDRRPKCLVPLNGRTLLDRQLEVFKTVGIQDVSIVLGHAADSVDVKKLALSAFYNFDYAKTNMVASLERARSLFDGSSDLIVSYGDIVYERRVLRSVLGSEHAIAVAVDRDWRQLWELRMEDPLADAETMRIGANGRIEELGKKPKLLADIQGQYIGLFRIRADVAARVMAFYDELDPAGPYDGRDRANMFMTSFIQALIDVEFDVGAVLIDGGWLEIDTLSDLERYQALAAKDELSDIYNDQL